MSFLFSARFVFQDMRLSYVYWLFLANRGILFPPGFDDQWTVSIQHSEADIERLASVFREFARALRR